MPSSDDPTTEGLSPGDWTSLGLGVDVQTLWKGIVADEVYVSRRAWQFAILDACPLHPAGGCGVERLGSYPRLWPKGCRIPRFWCPLASCSISLLPESLAAGIRGPLDAIETAAEAVESVGITASVDAIFPPDADDAIGLVAATRALRRRSRWVRAVLAAIITLMPDRFVGVAPTLTAMRAALGVERVLVMLRSIAETHLDALARPFGFRARVRG